MGELLRTVERPATLRDDETYQLVNAKRSRGGVVPRERLLGRDVLVKTQFHLRARDFLISRRQIIHGACGVVPDELDGAVVSNEYDVMRVNEDQVILEYLEALSHTEYFQKGCFHSSVGVDVEKMVFKLDQFLQLPFPLPPLPEQRKIAEILGSVDEAIRATEAVIEQTRKVKEGLLQELLTKGIGHTKFKQTEIGEIPVGWKVSALGVIADVSRGKFTYRPRNAPHLFGGVHPFVQTGDVSRAEDLLEYHSQTLSEDGAACSRSFRAGTILITIAANIGEVALTTYPVFCPDSVVGITPLSVNTDWLFCRLAMETSSLKMNAPASAQKNINLETLRPLLLGIPSAGEQEKIARIAVSYRSAIRSSKDELRALKTVKAGLLQDLLTGKVRVKV